MYLTKAIPLIKLPLPGPQALSYFSNEKLEVGALILVPLRNSLVKAIVLTSENAENKKIEIKKSPFQLKKIQKILTVNPVLTESQLKLAFWMHEYYYTPLGIVLKLFINSNSKNAKKETKDNRAPQTIFLFENKPYEKYAEILNKSKNALILAPDKLSTEFLFNFLKKKLKNKNIFIYSAGLKKTEKEKLLSALAGKNNNIIIGVRSTIFLPFNNLDLIIIDQEENIGHTSWDQHPRYNAKTATIKLAEIFDAKIIISSASPSIESFNAADDEPKNNFSEKTIEAEIFENKNYKKIISNEIFEKIKETVKNKKKALILTARKAEAGGIICQDCGFLLRCKNCSNPLLLSQQKLICKYCKYTELIPELCPSCHSYKIKSFGIGAEKIENEFRQFSFIKKDEIKNFSNINVKDNELKKIPKPDYKIIISTQALIKPYAMPKFGLVFIFDISQFLNFPDFRQNEKFIQTLIKLKNASEKIIIQVKNRENDFIEFLNCEIKKFYKNEIESRKNFSFPPFVQLVKLTISDKNEKTAEKTAENLYKIIKKEMAEENILGPSQASPYKVKNRFHWNILLKFIVPDNNYFDEKFLIERNKILTKIPSNWEIDVDPMDTL